MSNQTLAASTLCAILLLPGSSSIADKPPVPVKCSKDKVKKVWRSSHGQFTVKNGLAEDTYSGYVGRSKLKVKSKCLLKAKAGDRVMVVFDEKHKRKLRISSHYEMQCVDAVKPTGKFLSYDAAPQPGGADGKSWTPPCSAKGLNKAEKKVCSKGKSNSERWDHYKARIKKSKTYALDFYIRADPSEYSRPSEPLVGSSRANTTADEVAPSGKLFCQYYSKNDENVLFAVTFDVPLAVSKK